MSVTELFVKFSPRDAGYCRADRRRLLGDEIYQAAEPHLEVIVGRVTGTHPRGQSNRYEVRHHGDCWLCLPFDDMPDTPDAPWPVLGLEDVQLWRLSGAGWRLAGELTGWTGGQVAVGVCLSPPQAGDGPAPAERRGTGEVKEVDISPDYKTFRIGRRKIDLSRKPKARAFLRFARERMNGNGREFEIEEMRDNFNAQFGEGLKHKGWNSDRLREDLFRGLKREEFDLLFDTVNLAAGIYRLKI
jgi:hypothetical protein